MIKGSLLVHSPNACTGPEPEPGVSNAIHISHMGGRTQLPESSLLPPRVYISRKPESGPGRNTPI